jgi:hypothetical protein
MRTWKNAAIAILGFFAFASSLAALASPRREIPFTGTAVATWVNFGTALDDGTRLLILNAKATAVLTASDARVSGAGTVTCSGIWHTNKVGVEWGILHLSNAGGAWDGYWQATNSVENGHVIMSLLLTAEGSSRYQGLVFRSTCTAVDDGPIQCAGCIVQDGQGSRPYQLKGFRLDGAVKITGMLLDPLTLRPTGTRGTLEWIGIVTEIGEASYLGRTKEHGLGLLDPVTGVSSMMGTVMPADSPQGDALLWVALATTDLRTGAANAEVHFAGGTGKFEDATGGFSGRVTQTTSPTPGPTIFHNTFYYGAAGTIRFRGSADGGE